MCAIVHFCSISILTTGNAIWRWTYNLFAWCVTLRWLLVGFRTHFKSMHFHSLIRSSPAQGLQNLATPLTTEFLLLTTRLHGRVSSIVVCLWYIPLPVINDFLFAADPLWHCPSIVSSVFRGSGTTRQSLLPSSEQLMARGVIRIYAVGEHSWAWY